MVRLLTTLAAFAGVALAVVTVPSGLADGVYTISMASNEVTLVEPLAKRSRIESRQTLPSPETTCGSSRFINIQDFIAAKELFADFCDREVRIEPDSAVLYVSGTAMAYLCNYGGGNWCHRNEYDRVVELIVDRCGTGSTGEVYIDQYAKTYGADNAGKDICY